MAVHFRDVQAAKQASESRFEPSIERIKALLVGKDSAGSATVNGRPGYVWVKRFDQEAGLGQVLNRVVAATPNLPVIIQRQLPDGQWEVAGWDTSTLAALDTYSGQKFQAQHAATHQSGGLDPLYIESKMLIPLRVTPAVGLTVDVAPLVYEYAGAMVSFAGSVGVDLSGYKPAAGEARYVLISLATDTAALAYTAGAITIDSDAVLPDWPTIPPGDIPAALVRLDGSQTGIAESDIVDARMMLNAVGLEAHTHVEADITDLGDYEPANANIQSHIASTSNPHGVTATQIGAAEASHTHSGYVVTSGDTMTGTLTLSSGSISVMAGGLLAQTAYKVASALPAAWPSGMSQMIVDTTGVADGWPWDDCLVITQVGGNFYAMQTVINNSDSRQRLATDGLAWGDWLATEVDWDDITNVPTTFPPEGHTHDDRYYTESEVDALLSGLTTDHGALTGLGDDDHTQYHTDTRGDARYSLLGHNHAGVYEPANANIQSHIASTSNPHGVTKSQVGLGNADNTSDADKPVSTAQQAALDLKASLASPALTGTPTAPTAAANTNTTQIATTAFVNTEISTDRPYSNAVPLMNGTAAQGSSARVSRQDHVHPTDTSRAPLASPALTGTPTAPTAAADTDTTQIATTAFSKKEADDAQAFAVQRVNHTGTQAITTVLDLQVCHGRLTLTSGNSEPVTDVTGAGTLYFTPHCGNLVSLYNGTNWVIYEFSEISLALSGLTTATNYDVFLVDSGSLALELVAWASATTRATALAAQDGVYVKSGDATRRYIGTIRATGAATSEDSYTKRFVWNYYNRIVRQLHKTESTVSWTYASVTYRAANNNTANAIELVVGVSLQYTIEVFAGGQTTSGAAITASIGKDAVGNNANLLANHADTANHPLFAFLLDNEIGYHIYYWCERSQTSGTNTFYSASLKGIFCRNLMG